MSASDTDDMLVFEDWMKEYNKTYTGDEKTRRFKLFQQTLGEIENHNLDPRVTHFIGLNKFADMSFEEFQRVVDGITGQSLHDESKWRLIATMPYDDMLVFEDWMKKHNKTYTGDEKARRFKTFQEAMREVENHNSNLRNSNLIGMNIFADMSSEEFKRDVVGSTCESDEDTDEEELIFQVRKLRTVPYKLCDEKDTKKDVTAKRQTRGDEKEDTKEDVTVLVEPEPKKPKN